MNQDKLVSIGVFVPVPDRLDSPIVLDRVALLDPSQGLAVNGAVASTGDGTSFSCVGAGRGFPPRDCTVFPLEGWRVNAEAIAHKGFQVVLGLSVSADGTFNYPAVTLSYHDDDAAYEAVYLQGGQLCSPRDTSPNDCGTDELLATQSGLATALRESG